MHYGNAVLSLSKRVVNLIGGPGLYTHPILHLRREAYSSRSIFAVFEGMAGLEVESQGRLWSGIKTTSSLSSTPSSAIETTHKYMDLCGFNPHLSKLSDSGRRDAEAGSQRTLVSTLLCVCRLMKRRREKKA